MYIKEFKIPTWNELLGIKDKVRFRFIYKRKDGSFTKTSIYTIVNNQLLFAEDIPYVESYLSVNYIIGNDDLVGIEVLEWGDRIY